MDELPEQVRRHSNIERLETQLGKYFAGTLQSFDLPLDLRRTPFQRASWEALLAIPYGEARSYREQAEGIGKPTAVRAVGRANGDNRVAIIVPCHRVVGAEGKLTGYVWRKRFLLELERENRRIETSEPAFPPRPGAWKPRSLVHRKRAFPPRPGAWEPRSMKRRADNPSLTDYHHRSQLTDGFGRTTEATMAKATARHILVDSEGECLDLIQQLGNGADFEQLAAEHSNCPSGQSGGDLGEFSPGQMVPEFDQVVFNDAVGEIHGPIATQFGYHIIEITSRSDD